MGFLFYALVGKLVKSLGLDPRVVRVRISSGAHALMMKMVDVLASNPRFCKFESCWEHNLSWLMQTGTVNRLKP